jgi:tRNA-2-methylthio-N6-dimethylallyladenosine synthase
VALRYYIHTFGCQMNESDSQRMGEALSRAGWDATGTAEGADLVLVNTCAIREKAEDKLYSALGRYRLLKAQRGTKIGVAGCVAQQEKEALLKRAPFVDFVLWSSRAASRRTSSIRTSISFPRPIRRPAAAAPPPSSRR